MADISKISVNEQTYDIKDANARGSITTLEGQLGDLAYKDSASGSYTPAGSVTAPTVNVTPSSMSLKHIKNTGSLPSWGANVSEEVLSFSFSAGSLPTTENHTVLTGITDATATAPVFSGTAGTVTVS